MLANYIKGAFPSISDADLQQLLKLYPDDPAAGAPYGTGQEYQLAPGYKRIGSLAGDIGFDSNHRLLARHLSQRQKVWSYCAFLVILILRGHSSFICDIVRLPAQLHLWFWSGESSGSLLMRTLIRALRRTVRKFRTCTAVGTWQTCSSISPTLAIPMVGTRAPTGRNTILRILSC